MNKLINSIYIRILVFITLPIWIAPFILGMFLWLLWIGTNDLWDDIIN